VGGALSMDFPGGGGGLPGFLLGQPLNRPRLDELEELLLLLRARTDPRFQELGSFPGNQIGSGPGDEGIINPGGDGTGGVGGIGEIGGGGVGGSVGFGGGDVTVGLGGGGGSFPNTGDDQRSPLLNPGDAARTLGVLPILNPVAPADDLDAEAFGAGLPLEMLLLEASPEELEQMRLSLARSSSRSSRQTGRGGGSRGSTTGQRGQEFSARRTGRHPLLGGSSTFEF